MVKTKLAIIITVILVSGSYYYDYINRSFSSQYFGIENYQSKIDFDNDGLDDQTDMLRSARDYLSQRPLYKSKYYGSGYPDDNYGVCTDVIAFAMLNSGYDIMELLNSDIRSNREEYDIEVVDKHIDFRRVQNLKVYFDRHLQSLTTNITEIDKWHGGDIVVFEKHIAIISDRRNRNGVPFIIHLGYRNQVIYEENVLEKRDDIIGHYRLN